MENPYFKSDITENYTSNVNRKLFKDDLNEDNLNGIVPLPIVIDNEQVNYPHYNEFVTQDDVCFESNESAYNSDCSLGSMNSLFMVLKDNYRLTNLHVTNRANKECLQHETKDTSKINKTSGNKINPRTRIPENKKCKVKINKKPTKKITTICFYGQQKKISRHINSRLFYERQQKKKHKNKKILKTRYSDYKYKKTFKKLRYSSKNRKYRSFTPQLIATKNIFNNNSIRNRVKKSVPLLKLNRSKIIKEISQNIEKHSSTSIIQNEIIHNEDFITDNDNFVIKSNDKLFESNTFFDDDFMDTEDDFGGTKEIDNIIKILFEESINEINGQ